MDNIILTMRCSSSSSISSSISSGVISTSITLKVFSKGDVGSFDWRAIILMETLATTIGSTTSTKG